LEDVEYRFAVWVFYKEIKIQIETLLLNSRVTETSNQQINKIFDSEDKTEESNMMVNVENIEINAKGKYFIDCNRINFTGGDTLVWLDETLPFDFEIKLRILRVEFPEKLVF